MCKGNGGEGMLGSKEQRQKESMKGMEVAGNQIMDSLMGEDDRRKDFRLEEVIFWRDVGRNFFKEFYNKGINCETVHWEPFDDIINFLYKSDKVVKRFIEYHYGKKFNAYKSFSDESDVLFVRDFLNMYKPKQKNMIVVTLAKEFGFPEEENE